MKSFMTLLLLSASVFFINAFPILQDEYTLSNDYTFIIQGTSNLHDWTEKVQTASGVGVISLNKDGSFDVSSIRIKMNAYSIKSKEGSVMDNNTYKALKASVYPEIIFVLNAPLISISSSAEKIISAKGKLTVAGVTNSIDLNVHAFIKSPGVFVFEGIHTIKMTDYNISPPKALLGTLKTGDEISIQFKTSFTKNK